MKVKDILQTKGSKVATTQSTTTIQEAVKILVTHKIGALLVLDGKGEIAGIVTERDIMRGCHEYGSKLPQMKVSQVMTERIIVGGMEDELDYIMNIMTYNRMRHVPIVDNGKLEGIISIGDVVKAQLHDSQAQIKYLKDYMHGHQ